eukprot:523412-Hanusia_phi.AAC.3
MFSIRMGSLAAISLPARGSFQENQLSSLSEDSNHRRLQVPPAWQATPNMSFLPVRPGMNYELRRETSNSQRLRRL